MGITKEILDENGLEYFEFKKNAITCGTDIANEKLKKKLNENNALDLFAGITHARRGNTYDYWFRDEPIDGKCKCLDWMGLVDERDITNSFIGVRPALWFYIKE